MTGFTKGPWEWEKSHHGYFNLRGGTEYVISSEENYGVPYMEISYEDAHLISASPELYEALEDILTLVTPEFEESPMVRFAKEALDKANPRMGMEK